MKVAVKLFAALREQAGTRASGRSSCADGASVDDVWPALGLGDEPAGLVLRGEPRLRRARHVARGRRRGGAHPARLGRRVPALGRAALARAGRRPRSPRTSRRDRDVRRARPARARAAATSCGSSTRPTRGWPRRRWSGSPESCARVTTLIDVAIHHRVGPVEIGETSVVIAVSAPHRADGVRRLPRRDRHAQADRAALEEGALRRRRGMDRPGLLSATR